MVRTKVEVRIHPRQPYFTTGDSISGYVNISTDKHTGLDLRSIELFMRCDINVHIERVQRRSTTNGMFGGGGVGFGDFGAVPTYNNTYGTRWVHNDVDESVRLYEDTVTVPVPTENLPPGSHSFQFSVPFPNMPLPPSVYSKTKGKKAIGSVTYYVKASVRRRTTAIFAKSNLKAKSPSLLFRPVSYISQPELLQTLSEVDFAAEAKSANVLGKTARWFLEGAKAEFGNDTVASGVRTVLNEVGLVGSRHAHDFFCTALIPTCGFQQNTSFDLGLKIRPVSDENILVRKLTLNLDTIMNIEAGGENKDFVVESKTLVEEHFMREGRYIDLSEFLKNLWLSEKVVPSFTTPILSYKHQLSIICQVYRHYGEPSRKLVEIRHDFPVTVLSPAVQVAGQLAAVAEPQNFNSNIPPPSYEESI